MSAEPEPAPTEPDALEPDASAPDASAEETPTGETSDDVAVEHDSLTVVADDPLDKPAESDA